MINLAARRAFVRVIAGAITILLFAALAVGQPQDAKKTHTLRGKVEGVDATAKSLTVNHGKVEGWMDGMTMKYKIDNADVFKNVKAGDTIALRILRGAEELSRQLIVIYSALIARVEQYRGSVISFSGDAITCWFDDVDGLAAPRAATCALAMQAVMAPFAAITLSDGAAIALTIKIAVASGPARRFVAGDPTVQHLDVLAGATIARLAAGEHLAAKGEVMIDEATAATLGGAATLSTWRNDDALAVRFAVLHANRSSSASGAIRCIASAGKPRTSRHSE
jgi:Cu/Ag efflux protein CusF